MKSRQTHLASLLSIVGMLLIILSIAPAANAVPPVNDNFANASAIASANNSTTGTTVQATKETGEPNHAGSVGGASVWFRWTAPAINSSMTFTTRNSSTTFDTLLAVYTGSSVNNLTPVVSNDDFGNTTRSRVTFATTANAVYYIAIDGVPGATGTFGLNWFVNKLNVTGTDYCGCGNEVTVFRPSNGTWYTYENGPLNARQWGANGDVPAPADYDGDGLTDLAVFRPSNGGWYILQSATSTVISRAWGQTGDKPVPGDYFADGRADIAIFRPSNGTWYIIDPYNNATKYQPFGQSGDKPAQLDYDGDGKIDVAVFRPGTGTWYILNSSDNSFRAQVWGQTGDIPVPGDYGDSEFDGKADIAVWRPSNGYWYVLRSRSNTLYFAHWGQSGDVPQPGGFFSLASNFIVYRPSTSTFYVRDADTAPSTFTKQWGSPGDIPAIAAYVVQP